MKPAVTVSGLDDLAAAIARALAELRTRAPPPRTLSTATPSPIGFAASGLPSTSTVDR